MVFSTCVSTSCLCQSLWFRSRRRRPCVFGCSDWISNDVLNHLPDTYSEYATSVLAGKSFTRSAFDAGFPLFARTMYNRSGPEIGSIDPWFPRSCTQFYAVRAVSRQSNHKRSALQLCWRSPSLARHYAKSTVNMLERTTDVSIMTRTPRRTFKIHAPSIVDLEIRTQTECETFLSRYCNYNHTDAGNRSSSKVSDSSRTLRVQLVYMSVYLFPRKSIAWLPRNWAPPWWRLADSWLLHMITTVGKAWL